MRGDDADIGKAQAGFEDAGFEVYRPVQVAQCSRQHFGHAGDERRHPADHLCLVAGRDQRRAFHVADAVQHGVQREALAIAAYEPFVRPALAEPGNARVHASAGIGACRWVAVVQNQAGTGDQVAQHGLVQGACANAPLVGVQVGVHGAGFARGPVGYEGRQGPCRETLVGLQVDRLGAVVANQRRAVTGGDGVADIDNANALQCPWLQGARIRIRR